jgi:hypothetical protein
VTIYTPAQGRLLAVWHRFAGGSTPLNVELPASGSWRLAHELGDFPCGAVRSDRRLQWAAHDEWTGGVLVLHAR